MKTFSIEHICLLLATITFLAVSCFAVSKMKRKWQNVMFIIAAVLGAGGIFFRYAMNLSFGGELRFDILFTQILQVCNFNLILLPLMLVPKFELARQYSIYFSMFASCITLLSIPESCAIYEWNDPAMLSFWFNQVFAIALPLWMLAAERLIPQRRYIPHVSLAVFCYFTLVYAIGSVLFALQANVFGCAMSYVFNPYGMPVLTFFYELVGDPYVYLLPITPFLIGFFYIWSIPFNRVVRFDGNSGRGKLPKLYASINGELKLPLGGFIKEEHVLVGWRADPDGAAQFEPGEVIVVGKLNFKLYAVWKPVTDLTPAEIKSLKVAELQNENREEDVENTVDDITEEILNIDEVISTDKSIPESEENKEPAVSAEQ